jgi:hypothetical protein
MGSGKFLFKETEAKRLVQAAMKAGAVPKILRVDSKGRIELELGGPAAVEAPAAADDEWKVWGDQ